MAYYIGDIPVEDLVIVPARDSEPINLDSFEPAAEVTLAGPDGTIIPAEFVATVDPETGVIVEWPDSSVFDVAGVYTLRLTVVTSDDHRERLAPVYLVAQDDTTGWYTLDAARDEWSSADAIADPRLWQLLELAREQVLAYAPTLADGDQIPVRYRSSQLDQARNLLNSALVDPANGSTAGDDFVLRPYPLDWMIKQQLRPRGAVPVVAG